MVVRRVAQPKPAQSHQHLYVRDRLERSGLRRSGMDEGAVRASRSGDAARGVVGRLRERP